MNSSVKRCSCLLAGVFFTLLIASVNTKSYAYPHQLTVINKAPGLRKDNPATRIFYIAVVDTRDDSIGERCKADLKQMTKACQDISDWLYADKTEYKIISGNKYSKAAVIDALDNWLPGKQLTQNDIVIFYYSGHGFRLQSDTSQYPRMWLKTPNDKDVNTNNLRIEEDVYNRIVKLGAGMNVVLSDCCNNTFGSDNANYDNIVVKASARTTHKRTHPRTDDGDNDDDDEDYGDQLFVTNHPASILVTAAGKGELAGGKPDDGGFFTTYFLDDLYRCIYDNDIKPSWQEIFDDVNDKAGYSARSAACPLAKHNEQGRCVQTAIVKITGAEN